MTLCKFCREAPNKAVTTITIAGVKDLPACVPCYKEYQEQAYQDYQVWLCEQNEQADEDLNWLDHSSVGDDPRDSSIAGHDVNNERWL